MSAQYIDRSVIEAEIKRRISMYQKSFDNKVYCKTTKSIIVGRILGLKSLLSFINTLETKIAIIE